MNLKADGRTNNQIHRDGDCCRRPLTASSTLVNDFYRGQWSSCLWVSGIDYDGRIYSRWSHLRPSFSASENERYSYWASGLLPHGGVKSREFSPRGDFFSGISYVAIALPLWTIYFGRPQGNQFEGRVRGVRQIRVENTVTIRVLAFRPSCTISYDS